MDEKLSPAEIWQTLPVPDFPEPHPENAFGEAKNVRVSLTAASVRGRKHKHEGTNRDDFYAFSMGDTYTAVCVCDGAGSKKFSRIGAKLAAKSAVSRNFTKLITPEVIKTLSGDPSSNDFLTEVSGLASKVRALTALSFKAVEDGAVKRNNEAPGVFPRDISEYSSTFLYALIIPLEIETLLITLTIGDGNIAAFCGGGTNGGGASNSGGTSNGGANNNSAKGGGVKILGVSNSGEYSGETEFLESEGVLTEKSLRARTRVIREKINTVIIATDGVADDYFPAETEFLRLKDDIAELDGVGLRDFLDSYFIRGSFDDRTAVVIKVTEA